MFGPSQVTVDNGLTLTAQRNTNQYAGTYPWISGVVTTEGKFSLPTGGWYVQVKAKMPDTSRACGPPSGSCPSHSDQPDRRDRRPRGRTHRQWVAHPNDAGHSNYFAKSGTDVVALWNAGADMSAGYHIFGLRFIPGVSVKCSSTGFRCSRYWRRTASPSPLGAL